MIISGIYKIESVIKGNHYYIGSAINIRQRWKNHLSDLRLNKHGNKKLQNHYNKYGESDLGFSIIVGCEKENLISYEQFYIDALNPYFNICKIAGNTLGRKHTLESKAKVSKSLIGSKRHTTPHSEETKKKLSELNKGSTPWHKGKTGVYSEERLKQMSLVMAGRAAWNKGIRGSIPWNKGKKVPSAFKQYLKESSDSCKPIQSPFKGMHHSRESNELNRLRHIGKKQSLESIQKRVIKNTGRKNTEETIQKMKAARSLYLGKLKTA